MTAWACAFACLCVGVFTINDLASVCKSYARAGGRMCVISAVSTHTDSNNNYTYTYMHRRAPHTRLHVRRLACTHTHTLNMYIIKSSLLIAHVIKPHIQTHTHTAINGRAPRQMCGVSKTIICSICKCCERTRTLRTNMWYLKTEVQCDVRKHAATEKL